MRIRITLFMKFNDNICVKKSTQSFCGYFFRTRISWWRHQMEAFSALLAICAGNSQVPGEFPAQRPVTRSFDAFLDLHRINGWVNNGETGDLRRHLAHYDVTVMIGVGTLLSCLWNILLHMFDTKLWSIGRVYSCVIHTSDCYQIY